MVVFDLYLFFKGLTLAEKIMSILNPDLFNNRIFKENRIGL